MSGASMSDQERELHEVNGCLELLFTLRSEFAQWLGEAQDGSAREALEISCVISRRRNASTARVGTNSESINEILTRRPTSANRRPEFETTIGSMA
jgi:hypothetical protein